ncbi:hypothetical protein L6164_005880 [Bauhinia variegata]|uniref:Uncharacterized protein n=1 Tax=Bauhinia variegata TaxID=167791 RepID=A0ACB9PUI5_BAUVA|nr:hypothetical protein L6164_005880 [Bauhinia variegata]
MCLLPVEQVKKEDWEFSRRTEWWDQVMHPIKRAWFGVSTRLGIRKSGLLKLRRDVRACEYEDIHVMWEMLQRSETDYCQSPKKSKKRRHRWSRRTPYISSCAYQTDEGLPFFENNMCSNSVPY